jgi:hypothetical protein
MGAEHLTVPISPKLIDLMHSSRSVVAISRTKSRNNAGRERVSIEQPSYFDRLNIATTTRFSYLTLLLLVP